MVNYRLDGSKGDEEDGFEVVEEIHKPLNFAEVKLFFLLLVGGSGGGWFRLCLWWRGGLEEGGNGGFLL
uniref:Uncharacterized protein n=1 Tax=Fagus sylvatica TaxID=28930 RepID=A0A2N9FAS5_FAGSY